LLDRLDDFVGMRNLVLRQSGGSEEKPDQNSRNRFHSAQLTTLKWPWARSLLVENEQVIDLGELAVRLPFAEAPIFVVELVAVDHAVLVGDNRHQRFPTIGQQRRAL